jgi:hypothetical protein
MTNKIKKISNFEYIMDIDVICNNILSYIDKNDIIDRIIYVNWSQKKYYKNEIFKILLQLSNTSHSLRESLKNNHHWKYCDSICTQKRKIFHGKDTICCGIGYIFIYIFWYIMLKFQTSNRIRTIISSIVITNILDPHFLQLKSIKEIIKYVNKKRFFDNMTKKINNVKTISFIDE